MVKVARPAHAGFTLVELMITVAIMMILAVTALPFGKSWEQRAAIHQAQGLVQQAKGTLRATALRNSKSAERGAAAASLVLQGRKICVASGGLAANACPTDASLVWSQSLPDRVQAEIQGNTPECVSMDSSGHLLGTSGATACENQPVFMLTAGNETSTLAF